MPPQRIAFINPSGEIGGAERSLLLLLERLDRSRYAPAVFCSAAGRLPEALAAIGVPARVAPLGRSQRLSRYSGDAGWQRSFEGAVGIGQAVCSLMPPLQAANPDLIHTNGIKAHLIGGICGRLLRRPVLWHVRDLVPEGRMLALFRAAADRLPRRIIANSAAVAAQFEGRPAAGHTRIIHNAVDLARFRPARTAAAVRAGLSLSPDAMVLAMVAHFTPWKGHLLFLEIMARLVQRGLPAAGLIVGGSIYETDGHQEYEDEVRARCQALGLADRVIFTGYQDCVADFLSAADLLVHPPIRPEPFGRAVIEAMALAKPVVAAAAGGVVEIVEPGVTGLLVPPGDVEAFAQAIQSLLGDAQRRSAMGERGRRRVAQQFSPNTHSAQVESVYQEVCPI